MNTSKIMTRESFATASKKNSEKVIIPSAFDAPFTIEDAKKFLFSYDFFVNHFSEETLSKCLEDLEVVWRDLTERKFVPNSDTYNFNRYAEKYQRYPSNSCPENNGRPVRGTIKITGTIKNVVCEGYTETSGYNFIVPSNYQGLKISKMIRYCLELTYPWIRGFAFSCYEPFKPDYEIYIWTPKGSLYTPLKALEENDFSIVENRMKSYFKDYCSLGKRTLDEEKYNKYIEPLNTEEAAMLKAVLDKNKISD